jgi:hypothetical protein
LKLKSLQTSKGGANPQVKLNPSSYCVSLIFIQLNRLPGGTENMAKLRIIQVSKSLTTPTKDTYALSVLLNLALFTSIREFPDLAWFRTSEPMCSPSRSQSVQINSALLYLAWLRMFSAIGSLSCGGVSR